MKQLREKCAYHKNCIENEVVPDGCVDPVTHSEMPRVSVFLMEGQYSKLYSKPIPIRQPPPCDQQLR